jgi:N-acetylmuramoyl-L-alanine amidase
VSSSAPNDKQAAEAAAAAAAKAGASGAQTNEAQASSAAEKGSTASTANSKGEGALAEKIIVIDPGHQAQQDSTPEPIGPGATETKPSVSSGTRGVSSGVPESKVTLDIGKQLRDALEAKGATVYMTRTKQNVKITNSERAKIANENKADLFLRLHCDGNHSSAMHGISMLVPASNQWTKKIAKSSKSAGEALLAATIAATGAKNNGVVPRSDLSGFNWCERPSVLIEMGFMSNVEEDKKLNSASYQKKLVEGLSQGCIDWFSEKKGD